MFNSFIVSRNKLINNIKQVINKNPNSKICAMVKANAYGVGIENVVPILNNYVDFYGVACFFEAQRLRSYTNKKILIVGPLEYKNIRTDFSYKCSSLEDVKLLASLNKKINVHLKINSGMNRYGFKNIKEFISALKLIKSSRLYLEGVFTHFISNDKYVKKQIKKFNYYKKVVKYFGFKTMFHTDNSAVSLKHNHKLNMVRVGYNLFINNSCGFVSPVQIKCKIAQVNKININEYVGYNKTFKAPHNMQVAVVPIGYADGFSAKFVGKSLFFKNTFCKVLNVCMDCFMLDVTGLNVKKGTDIFVLNNINSLSNYAKHLNVSEYEVLANFSKVRANRLVL